MIRGTDDDRQVTANGPRRGAWEASQSHCSAQELLTTTTTNGGTSFGALETGLRSAYLEPSERIEATIEGIGTLLHNFLAGAIPPSTLWGAQLPPATPTTDRIQALPAGDRGRRPDARERVRPFAPSVRC